MKEIWVRRLGSFDEEREADRVGCDAGTFVAAEVSLLPERIEHRHDVIVAPEGLSQRLDDPLVMLIADGATA